MHRPNAVHPFLGRVVRRMRGPGRVLDEDGLAGVGLVHPRHPVDGIVGHRGDEVPTWLAFCGPAVDLRTRRRGNRSVKRALVITTRV